MKNNKTIATPGERLKYLIKKYFPTQTEFAKRAKMENSLIGKYCRGAIKIPAKRFMQIQENVGFSTDFISDGIGKELRDDVDLVPIISMDSNIFTKASTIKSKENICGEVKTTKLRDTGVKMTLSDEGSANIIDTTCDGIPAPTKMDATSIVFCNKYKIKIASSIVIDADNYSDGDVVFVERDRIYYLAQYYDNKLVDIADDTEIPLGEGTKIIGRAYSVIQHF